MYIYIYIYKYIYIYILYIYTYIYILICYTDILNKAYKVKSLSSKVLKCREQNNLCILWILNKNKNN